MSAARRSGAAAKQPRIQAPVFAALGDETRLSLVVRLSVSPAQSISQLTEEFKVTRQAITRHLEVLERAGVVRSLRSGREHLFELEPEPLRELRDYLEGISTLWDVRLKRLKNLVEK